MNKLRILKAKYYTFLNLNVKKNILIKFEFYYV